MSILEEKNSGDLTQTLKTEFSATDWPKEGGVVEVSFIRKSARKAYFDMGRFGTGIVYGVEMMNAKEAVRNLNPWRQIECKNRNP